MTPPRPITENCLLESSAPDGSHTVRRVLFLDLPNGRLSTINVESRHAFPTWETIPDLETALRTGSTAVRVDDPWRADLRPDECLTPASLRVRDRRLEVILPIVDPAADPFRLALDASGRAKLVMETAAATGTAVDKLYKWLRLWWQHGQTDNALLPAFANCGTRLDGAPRRITSKKRGRPSKLALAEPGREGMNVTESERQQLVAGGRRYWGKMFKGRALPLTEAYQRTIEDYFLKRLDWRGDRLVPVVWEGPEDDRRVPTYRQFCYWFGKERRDEEALKARHGERRFNLKNRAVLGSSAHMSRGPGDLYLIDATVADLHLLSSIDRRRSIGRGVPYLVVDHWSDMIVGVHAGVEGPSWMGAMMALENAFTEKVSFCARYGVEISEDDWPCRLAPRKLLADRGELISAPSDWLVPGFRMTVENTASWRADFKSFVEGQFKITNERGICRMPGWVDRLPERGGRDYRLDARLDVDLLMRLLIELALHHNHRHWVKRERIPAAYPLPEDLDVRPIDLWDFGIANMLGIGREFPREHVRANLLPSFDARATREGLSVKSGLLLYDSPTARLEGWFLNASGRQSVKVKLGIDERDVTVALLRRDGGRIIEECPLTPRHMARYAGRSLAEVLDDRDRYAVAAQASRGPRAQDRADLNVQLDEIAETAERAFADAVGPGKKVIVAGAREARGVERDVRRANDAFTKRRPTREPSLPGEYTPFPT